MLVVNLLGFGIGLENSDRQPWVFFRRFLSYRHVVHDWKPAGSFIEILFDAAVVFEESFHHPIAILIDLGFSGMQNCTTAKPRAGAYFKNRLRANFILNPSSWQ